MKNMNKITILNIIGTFLIQGIAFFTTPLFTRLLGTSQYGIYSIFNSWVLILTCLMGLSMCSSIGTGLYTFKDRYLSFRNSVLFSSTVICFFEVALIAFFSSSISLAIGLSVEIVIIIGLAAFAHYILNFAQLTFIYEMKAGINFLLSVSLSISSILLSIVFIYQSDISYRYMARIYGVVTSYLIVAVIIWIILFLKQPTGFNKEYLKYGIIVGFPIVFHSLSQQILGQSDRVMMLSFGVATTEIGIYSLFYTLSSVLSTLLGALNNSWCPFYYDDLSKQNWSDLEKKCRNYIEIFTVIGVGFLLLAREVSCFMADESYWSGINIIPLLALAVYFMFMYQFPVNFEFFHKKTNIIAIGTVGAGLFNIVLNAIMIPLWGMYGAAIATAFSYVTLFFAHFYIVSHMKNNPYHLSPKVFIPGLICMFAGTIAFYTLSPWWYIRWGIGIALGFFELLRIKKRNSIF